MEFLYSYLGFSDAYAYYREYFNSALCTKIFLVALAIGVGVAFVYYLISNFSSFIAKRGFWFSFMGLAFVLTLAFTPHIVIGKYDESSGRNWTSDNNSPLTNTGQVMCRVNNAIKYTAMLIAQQCVLDMIKKKWLARGCSILTKNFRYAFLF